MSLLVIKFGGTSVGDIERIKNAASKVAAEARRGHKVVVVVSAMAGATDQLLNYCHSVTPRPNPREVDAVAATGEQVSAGLMALALEQRGLNAQSCFGWQVPIRTDSSYGNARILEIDTERLFTILGKGVIPVLAGFQGMDEHYNVTTLGRGGSDTSAVALAAAIGADRCDIYTDVDGVFTADPRLVSRARLMQRVTYEEMLELASLGAKVLQTRSVEMALRYKVPLQVLSTFGNQIGSDLKGTLIASEEMTMEYTPVTGIAHSRADAKITLAGVPDKTGVAAAIFTPLARAAINVGTIVQTASKDGISTDVTFTVAKTDLDRATEVMRSEGKRIGFTQIIPDKNVARISLVGLGMRSHPGVAALMFETLGLKGVNIQAVETSEINVSVLIAEEYLEIALRALHSAFGLDKD